MSHILDEGDACESYTQFKAFCFGTIATVIWTEHNSMLIVKARANGHTIMWSSSNAAEKAIFHADYDANDNSYEIGHNE